MSTEIKVPELPESVADATVAQWHVEQGGQVKRGDPLVDLETDKVLLEVPAPCHGLLKEQCKTQGTVVIAGERLAWLEPGQVMDSHSAPASTTPEQTTAIEDKKTDPALAPAVRQLLTEFDIDPSEICGTGERGRILKEDVLAWVESQKNKKSNNLSTDQPITTPEQTFPVSVAERLDKRVSMTRLRSRIAERLVEVKQQTAMLTTFNEVNMQAIVDWRQRHRDNFEKQHDVRLGFMSFFIKASVLALKRFPVVNASIDGKDVVYHNYFDIGIAISSPRGLVVPIVRDAHQLSMAQLEQAIVDYAQKAREHKLTIDDMTGGTFTITNGGIFGSLLSTPILNPPQSAILGMHKIMQRPVVEGDHIVSRPMMYLALSYDHRIIDGRESVQFLATIKEALEDPARLLLDL